MKRFPIICLVVILFITAFLFPLYSNAQRVHCQNPITRECVAAFNNETDCQNNCPPTVVGGICVEESQCSIPPAETPGKGLVPCGTEKNADGTIANSCDLCKLYDLADNIIDFLLFNFILPVAVVALLIGGILLLASRGSPQMLEMGKTAISNTVVGVLIAFGAWLIIGTVVNTLGYNGRISPAWNVFPGCQAPIKPPAPIVIVPEKCVYDPNKVQTSPCPGADATWRRMCNPNGYWSTCFQSCLREEIGKTRDCKVGTCDGSQTCMENVINSVELHKWSDCKKKDPTCQGGGGTCQPIETGTCSVAQLSSACFGNLAHEASQICRGESGGFSKKKGDPITGNGKTVFRSIGLFQINLSVHPIGGLPCPTAFEGKDEPLKNTPEALELYNKCVAAAENANTNIQKACEIRNARGNWQDWWCVAHSCNLHSTPCPRK